MTILVSSCFPISVVKLYTLNYRSSKLLITSGNFYKDVYSIVFFPYLYLMHLISVVIDGIVG